MCVCVRMLLYLCPAPHTIIYVHANSSTKKKMDDPKKALAEKVLCELHVSGTTISVCIYLSAYYLCMCPQLLTIDDAKKSLL
jgi:hypothetical protein